MEGKVFPAESTNVPVDRYEDLMLGVRCFGGDFAGVGEYVKEGK